MIIKNKLYSSYILFEQNRREYIEAMKKSPYDAFIQVYNRRYNCFDKEMSEATLQAFEAIDNSMKAQFIVNFEGTWSNFRKSFDIDNKGVEKSVCGFSSLRDGLEKLCDKYSNQPFKKKYTESFISIIDNLLKDEDEKEILKG